jgi:hypothetical protein
MCGAIPPLPQYIFMAWCLVKHRDNFTFTFGPYLLPCCMGPCRHDLARVRVADGRDGLLICRIAHNISNEQSRQPKRGGLSDFGVGRWANNS